MTRRIEETSGMTNLGGEWIEMVRLLREMTEMTKWKRKDNRNNKADGMVSR